MRFNYSTFRNRYCTFFEESDKLYNKQRKRRGYLNTVTLKNDVAMPQFGFGVFQIGDAALCEQCVCEAIEDAVGNAISSARILRKELFVTTKLWIQDYSADYTLRTFEQSLKRLKLDYLDLYLLHQPFGDTYDAWRTLERLYKENVS